MATINERCQARLRMTFTDVDGAAVIPTTLKYKIVDEGTRTTIVPVTIVSPSAATYDLTITADQNRIIRDKKQLETRKVSIEVYSVTTLICSASYTYNVQNLYKIPLVSSTSPSISPSVSPSPSA